MEFFNLNEPPKTADVIGEGTYGCIHKPSLKCKNKNLKYNKKISKILLKKNAKKEMDEYDILSKIDKKHNYYLGNPVLCEPAENEYNLESIKKCETFKDDDNQNINDNDLIIMNDGGINLEVFADKMHERTNSSETTKIMELFWIEFHRVLMGIQLFLKNGIIHFDMKPQNIVYNETTNRINIIDFGLMRKMDEVINKAMNSDNFLGVYHWSYPFECNFHNKKEFDEFAKLSIDSKKNYHMKIIDKLNKKSKSVSSFRNFFSFVINQYDSSEMQSKMIHQYMDGFLNFMTTQLPEYKAFLQTSLETLDLYGVGIAIAYVNNMTRHLVDENFSKDLHDLAFQMTNSNMSNRYTTEQSIHRFEEILKAHNITQKHKVNFKNNKLVKAKKGDKSGDKQNLNPNAIMLSKYERSSDEIIHNEMKCPDGNEFDNTTRKCHKKCPKGKIRNKITRRCIAK
jgi:serine/threonine protein kinase